MCKISLLEDIARHDLTIKKQYNQNTHRKRKTSQKNRTKKKITSLHRRDTSQMTSCKDDDCSDMPGLISSEDSDDDDIEAPNTPKTQKRGVGPNTRCRKDANKVLSCNTSCCHN